MRHTLLLLSLFQKTRLDMRECAHLLNISYSTARIWRSAGKFPVPMSGEPLTASIYDVGAYLESLDTPCQESPADSVPLPLPLPLPSSRRKA